MRYFPPLIIPESQKLGNLTPTLFWQFVVCHHVRFASPKHSQNTSRSYPPAGISIESFLSRNADAFKEQSRKLKTSENSKHGTLQRGCIPFYIEREVAPIQCVEHSRRSAGGL